MKRDETMLAVLPSVLARTICNHCLHCDREDPQRDKPLHCRAMKRLITELKHRNAKETTKNFLPHWNAPTKPCIQRGKDDAPTA